MPHYIALIHKQADTCYGVSFPDVPGVTAAGDTIDEAMQKAVEVLEFAAQDWPDLDGKAFPAPRTIDELRGDLEFQEAVTDAVVAAVPFKAKAEAAECSNSKESEAHARGRHPRELARGVGLRCWEANKCYRASRGRPRSTATS